MSLGLSTIIDTARALMAALQPITGGRAVGQLRMRAKPGIMFELPEYAFFIPIVDGSRFAGWLFKVAPGPNPNRSWTVDDSGNTLVTVMSNIGGVRHNLPAGTFFVTDIDVEGLITVGADRAHAEADFQQGSDPETFGIKDMALYETFDGPAVSLDIRRSPIKQFPGVLVAFQDMTPADGVAIAHNNQQAVAAGDGKSFFKMTYSISVVIAKVKGDQSTRFEGLVIANTIASLLNDKHAGDVNEPLSNPGGVQIRQLIREDGPQAVYKKFYIYTLIVSCMRAITRIDLRTYSPWLRATMNMSKPQFPPLPDQGAITVVSDMELDMTPTQLDLAIDGTYTRADAAYLWNGEVLRVFTANERRLFGAAFGAFLEPAINNAFGAAALNFGLWSALAGATVAPQTETAPTGAGTAQVLALAADAASGFEFTPVAVALGEPIVVQVFARGKGNVRTRFRLQVDDGITQITSPVFEVEPIWNLFRFEATPQSTSVTVRLLNVADAKARSVAVWGALISNAARWGAMYPGVGTKVAERITFNPIPATGPTSVALDTPRVVLDGKWHLRWRTPADVTADTIGTGLPFTPTLVSVGDGASDLVALQLVGTPSTGGAALVLSTRGGGAVLALSGVEWAPGADIEFLIDVQAGIFVLAGTNTHDAQYNFPRYDVDATTDDFLTVGNTSDAGSGPVPGYYVRLGEFVGSGSGAPIVVNGKPVPYNGAFATEG